MTTVIAGASAFVSIGGAAFGVYVGWVIRGINRHEPVTGNPLTSAQDYELIGSTLPDTRTTDVRSGVSYP